MLPHPVNNQWQINEHALYPLLGLKSGGHLPKEGFGPRLVQGTWFKCDPHPGKKTRFTPHRVKYQCPICSKWIPFGRAIQHESRKDHR